MLHATVIDQVIDDRTKDGDTAVHHAARNGQLPVVKHFISELNFDPNTQGGLGRPPLVDAAEEVTWMLSGTSLKSCSVIHHMHQVRTR